MKLIPLSDWMIVDIVDNGKSKIVLPETYDKSKDDAAIFEIKAIGPGHYEGEKFIPVTVRVGQHVLVSAYGMGKVKMGDKNIYLARARDIAVVVEEGGEVKDAGVRLEGSKA